VIPNLGPIVIIFTCYGSLFVLLGALWLLAKASKWECVEKIRVRLHRFLIWNNSISLVIEVSLEILLSCFINMEYMYWHTFDLFVSSLLTHLIILAMLFFHAFLLLAYVRKDESTLKFQEF